MEMFITFLQWWLTISIIMCLAYSAIHICLILYDFIKKVLIFSLQNEMIASMILLVFMLTPLLFLVILKSLGYNIGY